jgi:hypothetical protein
LNGEYKHAQNQERLRYPSRFPLAFRAHHDCHSLCISFYPVKVVQFLHFAKVIVLRMATSPELYDCSISERRTITFRCEWS